MISYIILHLFNGKIYKVPKKLYDQSKTLDILSDKEIFEIFLVYEVLNRKPHKLTKIDFSRRKVSNNSTLDFQKDCPGLENYFNYDFCDSDALALQDSIPLPRAYVRPNQEENNLIYNYLKNKYPKLAEDYPYFLNEEIKQQEKITNDLKKLVKEAYKKKQKNRTKI